MLARIALAHVIASAAGCSPPRPAADVTRAPLANATPAADAPVFALDSGDDAVTIARLEPGGLYVLGQLEHVEHFAWVDDRTLLAIADASDAADGKPVDPPAHHFIERVVDGRVVDTTELDRTQWPPFGNTSIEVTSSREAYLTRCLDHPQLTEACHRRVFLAIYPTLGRAIRTTEPRGYGAGPGLEIPTAPPPRGTTIASTTRRQTLNGTSLGQPGVGCQRGLDRSFFPDQHTAADMYPEIVERASARWVQTDPPIYEVVAELSGPELSGPTHYYFRACSDQPLAGYAWLGVGLWASYEPPADYGAGTWTFRHHDRVLGELRGMGSLAVAR